MSRISASKVSYEARVRAARKLWIDGLLSDRFVQIVGALGDNQHGRCCLGVAADVLPRCSDQRRIPAAGYLSDATLRRLGLSAYDERELAGLNDEGVSFAEIAGVIEHLPIHSEA